MKLGLIQPLSSFKNLPDTWKVTSFLDSCKDVTRYCSKVPKNDYLETGLLPIIDQGKGDIAGFTNNIEYKYSGKLPVILFGDHTRRFKYIDYDFTIGADGVKVISMDQKYHPKFLYYFFQTLPITDTGYNRHFKYVKDITIPLPPLKIQEQITEVLDRANALIHTRHSSIKMLDHLIQSLFLEMFGDPLSNPKEWQLHPLKEITLKIGSGATPRGGKEAYKTEGISLIRSMNIHDNKFVYKDLAFIDDEQADNLSNVIIKQDDVLLNITGASVCRSAIVPNDVLPARVNQHVSIVRVNQNEVNPQYLLHLFISSYKHHLMHIAIAGGATREALTKGDIEELKVPLPNIDLQDQFAERVQAIESQKVIYKKSLDSLQTLFDSLIQQAFNGELELNDIAFAQLEESILS